MATWLYGRVLGAIFLIACVSLWSQLAGLVGSHGMVPAARQLAFMHHNAGGVALWHNPTLAWLGASDAALTTIAATGSLCAALLVVGVLPGPALLGTTVCYLSLVNVGGPFTRFQWDMLLLEAGFASMLVTPWVLLHRPRRQPPALARWVLYLLLFKLVFASGWVKLASGDPTWADLSALSYHYWTQPLPNGVAYWASQLPLWMQRVSCALMFVIELALPLAIFVPHRWARRTAAAGIAALMLLIMATGNYGFFNLLGLALCLPLLDDAVLRRALPAAWWRVLAGSSQRDRTSERAKRARAATRHAGRALGTAAAGALLLLWTACAPGEHFWRAAVCLAVVVAALILAWRAWSRRLALLGSESAPWLELVLGMLRRRAVETLAIAWLIGSAIAALSGLWPEQGVALDTLIEDTRGLHAFNRYGLFAVMTTERPEIILEGSRDGQTWLPYELPYKPGTLDRPLPLVVGHMPRLDWQMWFAALGDYRQNGWLMRLMTLLRDGEPAVRALFETDPFGDDPPRFVRAVAYQYHFTTPDERARTGNVWTRDDRHLYAPVVGAVADTWSPAQKGTFDAKRFWGGAPSPQAMGRGLCQRPREKQGSTANRPRLRRSRAPSPRQGRARPKRILGRGLAGIELVADVLAPGGVRPRAGQKRDGSVARVANGRFGRPRIGASPLAAAAGSALRRFAVSRHDALYARGRAPSRGAAAALVLLARAAHARVVAARLARLDPGQHFGIGKLLCPA